MINFPEVCMSQTLAVYRPGEMDYDEALSLQMALVERLKFARDDARDTLVLLTHPPVLTIGRGGAESNIVAPAAILKREGVTVREVSRGGDVTYHGPGQSVGYPIIDLAQKGKDIHAYLRRLESVIIGFLADYGIEGSRRKGLTGVWVGSEKIASIGVAITRWITYHGFALNVAPNLEHFGLINPCGIKGCAVTSMERILDREISLEEVEPKLADAFAREFNYEQIEYMDEPPSDAQYE